MTDNILDNSKISMGENVGWVTGSYDAVKAVHKFIVDGESYRKIICDQEKDIRILRAELTVMRNQLDNANAKLLCYRQHITEVNNDG